MNKVVSMAFLIGGIVLAVTGVSATHSFSSEVSRFFTGSPTNQAIWLLVGSVVVALVGLVGVLRGSNRGSI